MVSRKGRKDRNRLPFFDGPSIHDATLLADQRTAGLRLARGKRLAIYIGLNLEWFSFGEAWR